MQFSFREKERETTPVTAKHIGQYKANENNMKLQPSLIEPSMKSVKEKIADTFGGVSGSLILGTALDYASGLNFTGIIAARTSATTMNIFTSAPYGMWRNLIFRKFNTTENSRKIRKALTDLFAFNTFQTPMYAVIVAIGSWISEGRIDWDKVTKGTLYITLASPFISPAFGWYMDKVRKIFRIKSAAEQVDSVNQSL